MRTVSAAPSPEHDAAGRAFDRDLWTGIGLLVVLLVFTAALTARNTHQLREDARWVAHTREVMDLTSNVMLALVDAETGQRGFLINGKSEYLQPYDAAIHRLAGLLANLNAKTRDNPVQQAHIAKLEPMIAARLALLREAIARRRQSPNGLSSFFSTGKGKAQMDTIREQVAVMQGEERALLAERERVSRAAYQVAVATALATALLGLLAVGLLVWLMRRSLVTRQRAAAVLHQQREWFSTTLSCIGDAVIVTDTQDRVAFVNSVAQALTGWTEEEAIGQPLESVFVIVNEKTRGRVENPALHALRVGQIVGLANHTVLISKTGTECPIDDSASPIRGQQGEVIGAVLVFRDITARRREEEERRLRTERLEQAEERVRSVVSNALDGIITIDDQGIVASFNPAAERLFAYSSEEVIGQNVRLLMPEPYHGEHDAYLANYTRTGEAKIIGKGREVVGRRKDGSTFPMDLAVSEFRIGSHRSFIGIVRDVTSRKAMEVELRSRVEELAAADREKDEFLAVLAHELRNPLAPILNAVAIFRAKAPPVPELIRAREIIHRQTQYMARLLDDLLDVSRISRNNLQLRKERIALDDIVQRALETSRPLIEAAGHRLVLASPPTPLWLDADPLRLTQAISNILNNAAKYTDRGGDISFQIMREGSDVVLSVRDTGIGISAEHLPRVFDIFAQAAPTLERSQAGLGIGLSLVQAIVQMHGGHIEARSEGLGLGSEFIVRLPLAAGPEGALEHDEYIEEPSGARLRVVVGDDNADALESLGIILGIVGHEVHLAHDGVEAVELARAVRPHAILLDIGMPKLDGYDAARRIRGEAWGRRVVLVALTGWGQSEDKQRAAEAGFDYHLVKPVEFSTLKRLLRLVGSVRLETGGASQAS